jgi:hypothetical protein
LSSDRAKDGSRFDAAGLYSKRSPVITTTVTATKPIAQQANAAAVAIVKRYS